MGGAGLPWLVYAVVVAVIVLGATLVLVPWMRGRQQAADQLAAQGEGVASYEVPAGQDPAAVLAALQAADLHAEPDVRGNRRLIRIDARDGGARERARAAIAQAPLNTQGDPAPDRPVRFVDE